MKGRETVWVVDDASTDGSADALAHPPAGAEGRLRVIRRAANGGKGAAVLDAARLALGEGFTDALRVAAHRGEGRVQVEVCCVQEGEWHGVPWVGIQGTRGV